MGVIYKFKEEVVEYIIQYKKKNPFVGCRQLAGIVSEKYQLKVSKSSINAILKEAHLNSSVGRPRVHYKPAKFQIPSEKKQQLAASIEKFNLTTPDQRTKQVAVRKAPNTPTSIIDIPAIENPRSVQNESDHVISSEKDYIDSALSKPGKELPAAKKNFDDFLKDREKKFGPTVPNAGFVFLKAAEWKLSVRAFLRDAFQAVTLKNTFPYNYEVICEALLHQKFFDGWKSFKGNSAFFSLNNLRDEKDLAVLMDWASSISIPEEISWQCFEKERQLFTALSGFKLVFENKEEVLSDANLMTFWRGPVPREFNSPSDKLINRISEEIISNNKIAVFGSDSGSASFSLEFVGALKMFGNCPGHRLKKVSVLNDDFQEVAGFDIIPERKRDFVIGVWDGHDHFSELTKMNRWAARKPFTHEGLGRGLLYSETKTQYFTKNVDDFLPDHRVIAIWHDNSKEPSFALVSNSVRLTAEEIISAYLVRWPTLKKRNDIALPDAEPISALTAEHGFENNFIPDFGSDIKKMVKLTDLLDDLALKLQRYAQRYFLGENLNRDINILRSICCDLDGKILTLKNSLTVQLTIPADFKHKDVLIAAMVRFNEGSIRDPQGRSVWLEI